MSITRRLILKGLGAAPAVAKIMMEGGGLKAAEAIALNPMSGAGSVSDDAMAPDDDDATATPVTSFAEWLKCGGEAEIKRRAYRVTGFDPDIAGMRLPAATLVRMQRARNYERIRRNREATIVARLRKGPVKWWFDSIGHPDD